jgi:protein SCO1/2
MRRWIGVVLCLAGHVHAATADPVGFNTRLGSVVPAVTVRDETGASVVLHVGQERPGVLVLSYYTCAQLCGLLLTGLTDALRRMDLRVGESFDVSVLSIDPRDTSQAAAAQKLRHLTRYDRPGTDAGWHFYTADAAAIRQVTQAVGFDYIYDPARDRFEHPAGVLVVRDHGRVSALIEGVAFDPTVLDASVRDRSPIREARWHRQFALACGALDTVLGAHTPAVMAVLRWLVLVMTGTIGLLLWRRAHAGVASNRSERT